MNFIKNYTFLSVCWFYTQEPNKYVNMFSCTILFAVDVRWLWSWKIDLTMKFLFHKVAICYIVHCLLDYRTIKVPNQIHDLCKTAHWVTNWYRHYCFNTCFNPNIYYSDIKMVKDFILKWTFYSFCQLFQNPIVN